MRHGSRPSEPAGPPLKWLPRRAAESVPASAGLSIDDTAFTGHFAPARQRGAMRAQLLVRACRPWIAPSRASHRALAGAAPQLEQRAGKAGGQPPAEPYGGRTAAQRLEQIVARRSDAAVVEQ